jgi:hypothetical protein
MHPSTDPLLYVWMEGDEGRVKEREREDGRNILKISTFHEPSLYSTLLSVLPPPFQTYHSSLEICNQVLK